jgi:hypothetical protein
LIVAGCKWGMARPDWRTALRARPGSPPGGVNGAACHLVEAQAAETRRPSHTRNLEKRCFIAPNKCPGFDARGCVIGRHDWRCLETPALPASLDARAAQANGWVLAPASCDRCGRLLRPRSLDSRASFRHLRPHQSASASHPAGHCCTTEPFVDGPT